MFTDFINSVTESKSHIIKLSKSKIYNHILGFFSII